jgi:hypothetical protein
LPIFESLAAISVTLGLSIPVFMEKVMRPRYEERFAEFQKASRENFINELNDAATKIAPITLKTSSISPMQHTNNKVV